MFFPYSYLLFIYILDLLWEKVQFCAKRFLSFIYHANVHNVASCSKIGYSVLELYTDMQTTKNALIRDFRLEN